ncbi:hypothetical protein [Roseibium sp. Sym1]|uniref:hypothetical protein n=1 Tax=Roseibium sp. Sym1 TaxID=3016006 RepID=UPI0022B43507|nr:hypothetical protein [Roseibium sp. Sym1]
MSDLYYSAKCGAYSKSVCVGVAAQEQCDLCGNAGLVLQCDTSGEEYAFAQICKNCIDRAFSSGGFKTPASEIQTVAFQEGENWIVQGLERDICTQGVTENAARQNFVNAVILEGREDGGLERIGPAPARFWKMNRD